MHGSTPGRPILLLVRLLAGKAGTLRFWVQLTNDRRSDFLVATSKIWFYRQDYSFVGGFMKFGLQL